MKKILFVLLLASCSKSNSKPEPPAQPKWIVVNNYYESQTYVKAVKLNGKQIMGSIAPTQVKVDSTSEPFGTIEIIVTGGGGGDYISGPGSSPMVPASASDQTFTFQINGYSAFAIRK